MVITYHGAECFKISQGDITLAFNPISKDSKLKPARFGADVTLITTNLPDFNGRDQTSRPARHASAGIAGGGDKESFVIDGPGEYEIKDVFVKGFLSEGPATGSAGKPAKKINTIYLVFFEGMNLCFLGALANPTLSDETLEAIEDIDILFVPIGGQGMLGAASAYKLAVSLEPSIIIPMYYTKETLEQFIKEGGQARMESLDKLVVKKKDLEGKEGEIVVIKEE
ncbi:MAG: MBL fold metallo-hydrolase [bacterium]|nr:MBL fold metallo-hydrolase [bacterium]